MDKRIENRIKNMKNNAFGVEVEMAYISRDKAAKLVADYFGNPGSVERIADGYDSWICLDRKMRTWKFSNDSSIACPYSQRCEMVTPILYYEDVEDLQEIVRILRRNGAKSSPRYMCGVHVHVDATGHTEKSLRNLVNIMAAKEDLIIDALSLDSSRIRSYCRTVDPDFLRELNVRKPKDVEEFADIWYEQVGCGDYRDAHYNASRYRMLNLHSTFTKGTVEFRLFQFDEPHDGRRGGLHAGQLKAYIQFCLMLNEMALEAKSASPRKPQIENPRYAMRTWLLRLGFIGDEFKTARDTFCNRLSGDGAWRSEAVKIAALSKQAQRGGLYNA